MFLEPTTSNDIPPNLQLQDLLAELVYSPGETNYAQRSLFVQAKIAHLLSRVEIRWTDKEGE